MLTPLYCSECVVVQIKASETYVKQVATFIGVFLTRSHVLPPCLLYLCISSVNNAEREGRAVGTVFVVRLGRGNLEISESRATSIKQVVYQTGWKSKLLSQELCGSALPSLLPKESLPS